MEADLWVSDSESSTENSTHKTLVPITTFKCCGCSRVFFTEKDLLKHQRRSTTRRKTTARIHYVNGRNPKPPTSCSAPQNPRLSFHVPSNGTHPRGVGNHNQHHHPHMRKRELPLFEYPILDSTGRTMDLLSLIDRTYVASSGRSPEPSASVGSNIIMDLQLKL